MKKTFILWSFLFLFGGLQTAFSQTINGTPIKDLDVDYVQIVGTSKPFSRKITIQIDFGQHVKFFATTKETRLLDENGKPLIFNSMIDALNFMSKNGYEFVQAYVITVGNSNIYHYLLRKKKP
jgi:hypothetical protein